jgi:prepilin-type N-terminal cleavage/methylation domain-containing protein
MNKKKRSQQKGFTIIELMISTVIFSLVLLAASAAIIQIGKKYSRGITYTRTQEVARSTVDEIAQSLQFTSQVVKVPNYDTDNNPLTDHDTTYNIYNLLYATQISSGSDVILSDLDITSPIKDTFYFCIGAKRYSFVLNKQIETIDDHAFWVDEPLDGCAGVVTMGPADMTLANPSSAPYAATNGRELLDINMRITSLSVVPNNNGFWTIELSLATGDSDLLRYTYFDDGAGTPTGEGRISCEGSVLSSEFCATSEISVNVGKRIQ